MSSQCLTMVPCSFLMSIINQSNQHPKGSISVYKQTPNAGAKLN